MNRYLGFGRYSNLTYDEIILSDLPYVKWCCSLLECSPAMQRLKDYYAAYVEQSLTHWGYHLLLEDDCHYIGTTENWPKRISDHMRGRGAAWTRMHPVVKVVGRWRIADPKRWEKAKTLETMKKIGWERVRGYCWCQRNLSKPPLELKMLYC